MSLVEVCSIFVVKIFLLIYYLFIKKFEFYLKIENLLKNEKIKINSNTRLYKQKIRLLGKRKIKIFEITI